MRAPQWEHGRRNGIKASVEWLHAWAQTMNDPHARAILNTAGWNMGVSLKLHTPEAHSPDDGGLRAPSHTEAPDDLVHLPMKGREVSLSQSQPVFVSNDEPSAAPSAAGALQAVIATLTDRAQSHFNASNERKRPQWYCKAHAHAFAGLVEAIHVVEAAMASAAPLVAEIAHYAPSAGEDADELVSVRLGDLRDLRATHARAGEHPLPPERDLAAPNDRGREDPENPLRTKGGGA